MGEMSNKYVTIRAHIEKSPKEEDFDIITSSISPTSIKPGSNLVLVKCLLISMDPYQFNRMKTHSPSHNATAFASRLVPGKPIDGYGVGKVVASGSHEFQKDDVVAGQLIWAEYAVVEHDKLRKLVSIQFPLSYHLGILGISGLTAYGGFFQVCKPKKGEKVFVSTASGSVGYLVGQYAKLLGCYVVGCAGTTEKVALLKEKLGFDDAFNYKEEGDLKLALKRYFPDGIDIYFDNVGGEMLEAAISNMNSFGRVSACGAISQYTENHPARRQTSLDLINVIYKRITIQGFLVSDFGDQVFADFLKTTCDYLHAGKMQVLEEVSYGLHSVPSAFVGLFCGRNIGKTIVQIADN